MTQENTKKPLIETYKTLFPAFISAAIKGNAQAQHSLGFCYENGISVVQDFQLALKWYKLAAAQGDKQAEQALSVLSEKMQEAKEREPLVQSLVESDKKNKPLLNNLPKVASPQQTNTNEEIESLKLAAEQGDAAAQYNLGIAYYNGCGVLQNYQEAIRLFGLAAEQEHVWARYYLGLCYEKGEGVDQDYKEAIKWYKSAAQQGAPEIQCKLASIYYNRRKQFEEGFHWYQMAAKQGYATARNSLGFCYETGQGVTQDNKQAFYWYKRAADQGYAKAQNNLGRCYEKGIGVAQNHEKAAKWFELAKEQFKLHSNSKQQKVIPPEDPHSSSNMNKSSGIAPLNASYSSSSSFFSQEESSITPIDSRSYQSSTAILTGFKGLFETR